MIPGDRTRLLGRVAGNARRTARAVVAAAPGRVGVGLRAALAVVLPLSAGVAVGRSALGAAASFGALAVLYVPRSPYRYRARVVGRVGAGLVLAVLVGSLAAGHGAVSALVAGLAAAVASFVCQAAELPPPRELMPVMAVLAATAVPADPGEALIRAGLAAGGALVAWLLAMAPALAGGWRAPERAAVAGALDAVAGLLAAVGSAQVDEARHAAVTGVQQARTAVRQAALPPGHQLVGLVVAAEGLLEAALHVEVEATDPLDPAWAAAVRGLVPAVQGNAATATPLPEVTGTAGAALLARALDDARVTGASAAPPPVRTMPPWPPLHRQLAAGLRRQSVVVPSAARIGIAVAVGVGVGQLLGLGHAYWVGLTAAAVLQGSNLAVTRRRVVHRVAGTVAGVGLTFAVLGWNPPLWVVVLAVAVAQFAVELVIATHYGLAVTAITVLALGLFHLATPTEDVGSALVARLVDTAIGAALALVLRQVLWPRATLVRLPQRQAGVVSAAREVFAAAWSPDPARPLSQRRRALQGELAALRTVNADALADAGGADAGWPVSASGRGARVPRVVAPAAPPGAAARGRRRVPRPPRRARRGPRPGDPAADRHPGAAGSSPDRGRGHRPDGGGGGGPRTIRVEADCAGSSAVRDQAESRAVPAGVRRAGTRWPTVAVASGAMRPAWARRWAADWSQQQRPSMIRSGSAPKTSSAPPLGDSAQDRAVPPGQGFPVDHVRCRVRAHRARTSSLPVARSADPVAVDSVRRIALRRKVLPTTRPVGGCTTRKRLITSRASRIRASAARSVGSRRAKNSSASAARAARIAGGDLLAARRQRDQGGAPVGRVGVALDEPGAPPARRPPRSPSGGRCAGARTARRAGPGRAGRARRARGPGDGVTSQGASAAGSGARSRRETARNGRRARPAAGGRRSWTRRPARRGTRAGHGLLRGTGTP